VNIGSMISMTLTPWIRDYVGEHHGDSAGWHTAFGVCSIGLVLGLGNYALMSRALRHIGSPTDAAPARPRRLAAVLAGGAALVLVSVLILQSEEVARICVYAAGAVILGVFLYLISVSHRDERAGLIAALVLVIQTIFFFIFYQQMSTSLTLFALRNVDLHLDILGLHYTVPAGQVQALDPIWIFILSPFLAWLYNRLSRGPGDFHIASKFAFGFLILSLGFITYGVSGRFAIDGKVGFGWMVAGYGLQSLGELLISGLGLAMVARYVGPRLRGFIMGSWFLAIGISQYMGGFVATYAAVPQRVTDPVKTLPLYTHLFYGLGIVAVIGTLFAAAVVPLMKRLSARDTEVVLNVPTDPIPPAPAP